MVMGRCGMRAIMLALVLLTALPPTPATADGFGNIRLAETQSEAGDISADQAAEIVRSATGGRVLAVERRRNGRTWYRVKVLIDGQRVRYLAVDAGTGEIR